MPRLLLLTAFCFSVARDVAAEIYCEPEECYMVLGLESPLDTSTPPTESEIKKAYRQLSMVWHPDKCKEEGCEAKFVRIANAYTILSSRESREAYDYFLEHPEAYGHTARYYKAMLAPEVPLWIVVVGFIAVVSAIQWPLAWQAFIYHTCCRIVIYGALGHAELH
jgi:DnaJ family protein C protein 25